ncbi:hypothetical protein LG307_14915 [Sutcliffiella horikoshii]|uniref:hypothetical protein n=1 Tax=Sutcliffiella horikoshii TaxID=79883 RepID=UPI00384C1F64
MPTANLATNQAQRNAANEFVTECVELNRQSVVKAVQDLKQFSPDFIIETYTDQIIAAMLSNKSQCELIKLIANGQLFEARERIISEFKSDFAIRHVL